MLNAVGPKEIQRKPSDAFQQKSLHAVQEAAKQKLQTRGLDNESLPESEQVALSKELSEEVDNHQEHQGLDALMANLSLGNQPKLEQKIEDKVKEVGGASKIDNEPKKTKPQEVKAEWTPDTEKGKIHKGAEKIGDVRLTGKKKSPDSAQAPNPLAHVGQTRPGTKGAPKTDAPRPVGQVESGKGPKPDTKPGNRLFPRTPPPAPQDRVELSSESQKKLQPLLQSGNQQVAKEAEVRPTGDVKDGDILRHYQPLDGISPATLEAIRAMQGNHQTTARDKGAQLGLQPDEQQKIQQPQAIAR